MAATAELSNPGGETRPDGETLRIDRPAQQRFS